MLPQTELTAYQAAINIPLLNDIVAFVLETAEVPSVQRAALYRSSPLLFSNTDGSAFQEKYGFLYLGELLERYEERFGMTTPDFRAISLALAYMRDVVTDAMFVGPQRINFLRRLRQGADGDIYLAGALYLLDDGQSAGLEARLTKTYEATEELLFILSLFHDREQAFPHFKPQLLRLLGSSRTMPVLGNTKALDWLVVWLAPHLKSARGKDLALFRALCALPASFVKPGGKHHAVLLEHGYTPLEITYANMMTVLSQSADDVLRMDSIVTEKIVVALFQNALACESAFTPEVYGQLSDLYGRFRRFYIKYCGHEYLSDALKEGPRISNAETFLWFAGLVDIYHPAFDGFDILDGRWDVLSTSLAPQKYFQLFEISLREDMGVDDIRSRIEHYDALTGQSYTAHYFDNSHGTHFGLLVNKGILDLWNLFQNSLDGDGKIDKPEMAANIWRYARGIHTPQAFRFFEQFFTTYDIEGLERFFGYHHRDFPDALTKRQHYSNDPIILNLHRDFLDDDGHQLLLRWLEMFFFTYQPEKHTGLLTAILRDEAVAGLFSAGEQRELFDLAAKNPGNHQGILSELKRRYLTEAELQAERDAEAAARRALELRQREEMVQGIQERYAELLDGTFASIVKFLDEYKYYGDKRPIARRVVWEDLGRLLESRNYELDSQEAARFLSVCAKLTHEGTMGFAEAQRCINQIKERAKYDTDD